MGLGEQFVMIISTTMTVLLLAAAWDTGQRYHRREYGKMCHYMGIHNLSPMRRLTFSA